MNQFLSDPTPLEKWGVTFLVGFVVYWLSVIRSSRKEENPHIVAPVLREAKRWYEAIYISSGIEFATRRASERLCTDWSKKLIPNWSEAIRTFEQGAVIIEVPVVTNGEMTTALCFEKNTTIEFNKAGTATSLIIIKRESSFNIYAMSIVAHPSCLNENPGVVRNNTYKTKDKNFDGCVFFNKMNGSFVSGWRYKNGESVSRLSRAGSNCAAWQDVSLTKTNECYKMLTAVTLWEDRPHQGNHSQHDCFTYATAHVYVEHPVFKDLTFPDEFDESAIWLKHDPLTLQNLTQNMN